MGVPKFYRWISERYPCLSEVVKEFQLPEFDNLYLDMNGIIHVCSHPDDENPHFRISEEKIYKDICHYIDFLFRMIKPRKVFFMAVDGVAPRAKMNQQRGRRFRSAREAELLIKKAEEKGEVLPTEKRFDSNCITPGTSFMVRLQEHLKYFVVDRISHDPQWQGPKVYLSGHETPGEGEHKVMDFIRYSKSQADYDPDTRHCLYGLDADLIMLGLTSHDPHFSLLREEVRFGGKRDKNKRPVTPEETTFHLLHLSLMRDYLAYEFSDIKDKLPFPWDLEKIIDDWILMGFLVGNDFIPHLPHLHIHHDALPLLWQTYKNVLPTLDGYLNESGHLNLPRFEKYFEELSKFDVQTFESAFSDLRFLESKLGGKTINESLGNNRPKDRLKKLEKFKVEKNGVPFRALEEEFAKLTVESEVSDADSSDGTVESDDDDEDEDDYNTTGDEFNLHKRDYYMSKMDYREVTSDVLKDQAHGYVIAIQWILLYYFDGCPSWSWFYPHHYAPYISDVKGFSDMKITFELSKPFLPFQQLMAVLPAASKELLPAAYQPLMTDPGSPIVDFYPVNFETDLNGKQQDWEAVVLIPFIEEKRLLEAMASKEHLLTAEEKGRNRHGPHFMYQYTTDNMGSYPSSMPDVFPDVHINKAKITELDKDLFRIDANRLRKGLLDTVRLDVYFPGFPTLKFLPHSHELVKAGVKVFQHNSRGENMLLRVHSKEGLRLEEVADKILGKITYVGWPHIHEAKVIAVANESFRIELIEEEGKKSSRGPAVVSFNRCKLDPTQSAIVAREANDIKERLMNRFAIDVGNTEMIVYACPMTGRTYTYGAHGAITLEKQFAADKTSFLHQMTIQDLQVEESGHTTFRTLEEVFPADSTVFMVGNPHYGAQGKVLEVLPVEVRVRITLHVTQEPDFRNIEHQSQRGRYLNSYQAAQQIGIDSHIMSRITGSVFVEKSGSNGGRVNIGLNLKFTKKGEEVPGYTRKEENGWSYSYKCVKTVEDYITRFPDLWLIVQKQNSSTDNFMEESLFPEGCVTKLADVLKYLDELPCSKVPRMKTGSQILDEEHVVLIEKMTAVLNPKPDMVKVKVKPRLLFRPLPNQGGLVPDPGTDFRLYDRIVVVKSGYSVPFGRRGTIIGIPSEDDGGITPNSLYDVVFDEAFAGGITLRCSPGKGYRVPGSAMLNLTYGEFRKGQPSTGARASGRAPQNPAFANGSGNFGGHNNSNIAGAWQGYNERVGPYMQDKLALWQQQQQHPQQFQQQPVKWDKGQPLFGQPFAGQNQYGQGFGRGASTTQPKFVTPKVQGPAAGISSRSLNQRNFAPENRDTENSEFNNMWRNLLTHQNATQVTKAGDTVPKQMSGTSVYANSQSPKPNQNLAQGQLASAVPQQQSHVSQAAHSHLSDPTMQSASQQGQAPSGRLEPQLGGLLPKQPWRDSSQPKVSSGQQEPPKAGEGMKSLVQNLFQSTSNSQALPVSGENAEFLALFKSLQLQNEEIGRGAGGGALDKAAQASSSSAAPTTLEVKSQADLALKQLLKIGVESSAAVSPTSASASETVLLGAVPVSHIEETRDHHGGLAGSQAGRSPVPAYGRQLSLQELFEEANRQQHNQGVKIQQQQQQHAQQQQQLSHSGGVRSNESRDTVMELEAYCKNILNIGSPQYDYKLQPKQNAYIANVILPNGQRYEGSQCRTKEEAAKSAAGMAILCLNASPKTSHPLIVGYPPGAQRANANRFFSANSAFSPIGMPGAAPTSLPMRPPVSAPLLLTPQHFINQPPPPLSLHQLLQQQQQLHRQQQYSQQSLGQHVRNYGPEMIQRQHLQSESQVQPLHGVPLLASQVPTSVPSGQAAPSGTSSSSSMIQQFIPLQVSRNQKTPSRRKDSESEKSDGAMSSGSDTKFHNLDDFVTQLPSTESAMLIRGLDQHPAVSKDKKDKNGVVFQSSSSFQSGTLSSSSSMSSKSATPTGKSGQGNKKKKTRLAANFGTKQS
ncbi:hypothetical protein BsWGS_26524 [Bradybaena similaris]